MENHELGADHRSYLGNEYTLVEKPSIVYSGTFYTVKIDFDAITFLL